MPATRGAFAALLAPGLRKVIFDDLAAHGEEYTQIFNVYPSDSAFEEEQLVAGLGAVPVKQEGEPTKYDEPIQGGSLRYTHQAYGLGFQVTREMWDDDKYGIMRRVSSDFAGGIRQTLEATFANVINNSFTSTRSIDGEFLCSTAHPLLGGSTYSNRSATDMAFSISGLQEMLLLFEKMVNERGLLKRLIPNRVLIPVELQFKAAEILYSSYKPYTGNNEVNVMQGRLEPVVNHYLTSSTAWWMLSQNSEHTLQGFWRKKPEFNSQDDFDTKGSKHDTYFRFSAGVTYWHGVAGSDGV
jgi:hypothetical protein